jgi:signal transduction histidine kinase
LSVHICEDVKQLYDAIGRGAGAVLITGEALDKRAVQWLHEALSSAPAWSDLPLLLLVPREADGSAAWCNDEMLAALGNVTLLERPFRERTLLAVVRSALRARRRQYEIRDLLLRPERAVQRVDLLAEVASQLLGSKPPEEIVASVFHKIAPPLGLDLYVCYLLDEGTQRLHLSSQTGLSDAVVAERKWLNLDESFCGAVARQQKRRVAEQVDRGNDPAVAHVKALGVRAYVCFPLLANGRLIGTLAFGVRQRDRIAPGELAMLETVCNQVALAIERQRTEAALSALNLALERRVEERTSQLQESNEQMEAFAYSISHDLRAPLRAIRGFTQALAEDYSACLDDVGRDYLQRMGEGAERLDRLIQDLLNYSRLGRSTLTFDPIDLQIIVERVLGQMDAEIRASQAFVEIKKPLPVILGHEPTLEQVLVNLLSNALKFVPPAVKPSIQIWGTDAGTHARLWIADNGIGIAPAHHHRIFGVFERLHNTDAYPGTGIGLAIVAKGVARMGGSAGVESALGEGSRFWIELPRADPDRIINPPR